MHALTVVVAQSDCIVAEHLAANLHAHFKNVVVARDLDEIRRHVHRDAADIVILDLELAPMPEIRSLVCEFGHVGVVCTHHAPDEEMWRQCLEMGALDCCLCHEIPDIVRAAHKHHHRAAAAA